MNWAKKLLGLKPPLFPFKIDYSLGSILKTSELTKADEAEQKFLKLLILILDKADKKIEQVIIAETTDKIKRTTLYLSESNYYEAINHVLAEELNAEKILALKELLALFPDRLIGFKKSLQFLKPTLPDTTSTLGNIKHSIEHAIFSYLVNTILFQMAPEKEMILLDCPTEGDAISKDKDAYKPNRLEEFFKSRTQDNLNLKNIGLKFYGEAVTMTKVTFWGDCVTPKKKGSSAAETPQSLKVPKQLSDSPKTPPITLMSPLKDSEKTSKYTYTPSSTDDDSNRQDKRKSRIAPDVEDTKPKATRVRKNLFGASAPKDKKVSDYKVPLPQQNELSSDDEDDDTFSVQASLIGEMQLNQMISNISLAPPSKQDFFEEVKSKAHSVFLTLYIIPIVGIVLSLIVTPIILAVGYVAGLIKHRTDEKNSSVESTMVEDFESESDSGSSTDTPDQPEKRKSLRRKAVIRKITKSGKKPQPLSTSSSRGIFSNRPTPINDDFAVKPYTDSYRDESNCADRFGNGY